MQNDPILILLADDDENDRLLFTDAFQELKIKTNIHTVNDGLQLMEYLHKNKALLPQLLFLDLNMPFKNGIECLKEIRSNLDFREMSVAIFSTSLAQKDIDETFIQGANIYINKPNSFNELKEVLNKAVMAAYMYQEPPFNKANFLLRI
jgi:CheY-like chemotaxis protein